MRTTAAPADSVAGAFESLPTQFVNAVLRLEAQLTTLSTPTLEPQQPWPDAPAEQAKRLASVAALAERHADRLDGAKPPSAVENSRLVADDMAEEPDGDFEEIIGDSPA